jgi:uncharacterized protein (DUF433 family)
MVKQDVHRSVLAGKPVIRGTRLAVGFIPDLFAAAQSEDDILLAAEDFPCRP